MDLKADNQWSRAKHERSKNGDGSRHLVSLPVCQNLHAPKKLRSVDLETIVLQSFFIFFRSCPRREYLISEYVTRASRSKEPSSFRKSKSFSTPVAMTMIPSECTFTRFEICIKACTELKNDRGFTQLIRMLLLDGYENK